MKYWQVGGGDGRRDYYDVFTKYGVMLIGPGDPGPYSENRHYYRDEALLPKSDIAAVKSFAEKAENGDVAVLKKPCGQRWEIVAIGTVKGGYRHLPAFDDVEGWDLQHCRHVDWVKPTGEKIITGLTRGTFKRIRKESTIEIVARLLESGEPIPFTGVPGSPKVLDDEDLIDILINSGLRPSDAEDFTQTINRIRRLVKWYYRHGRDVGEHETRTFLIVPLLLALGWAEQKLKIEWKKTDIAFFERPYGKENRKSNQCTIILESKRFRDGLGPGISQARTYADRFPKCERLIVSDGCCYRLYRLEGDTWVYSAYLNILKPKLEHPYEKDVGGAPDVFLSLMGK